jgi:HAE1 family hydrophobic/amphiphilic exporter-1
MRKKSTQSKSLYGAIARLSFDKWRVGLLLWIFIVGFGALTYTSLIRKEGFPPIQFPVSFVSGFYAVNDAERVDGDVARPFVSALETVDGIDRVNTTATSNSFNGVVFFEDTVTPEDGQERVIAGIDGKLPPEAIINVQTIDPAAFLNQYDMLLTVYVSAESDFSALEEVATFVAQDMENDPAVVRAEVVPLFKESVNPQTGEAVRQQTNFNMVGLSGIDGTLEFYQAVTVGIDGDIEQYDVLELSSAVQNRINNLDLAQFDQDYTVLIGADFAESINAQIGSLESNLLTGLIAVALISLFFITWRASIITALFMVTVMAATIGLLYILGFTLNTITLFGLVLALGLFVDDATIAVESIDALKRQKKKPREIVYEAVAKIGAASFSGSATTILVFLPLAFVGGVLGEFIRLLPITVIVALVSSFLLSITLIPLLSRFVLFRHTEMSWFTRVNPVSKVELWLGKKLGSLPLLLRTRPRIGKTVAVGAVILSLAGVLLSFNFVAKVPFNIFPSSKDSDRIGVSLTFPQGYSIAQAEAAAMEVNELINQEIGAIVRKVSYGSFAFQLPNERSADIFIELVPFTERERKSPEIVTALNELLARELESATTARVIQYDAGPPADEFPLKLQIFGEDADKSIVLAEVITEFLDGATVERPNGTTATIDKINPPTTQVITRQDGKRYLEITAGFDADDTSALLVATEEKMRAEFSEDRLASLGFEADTIGYDFGQESENAESFAALGLVFPIALLAMFVLLAVQFKSVLQPLLIFMAIPFTFLGVFAGLYFSTNALSFFVMVGLIGLIGIAVNNTILLTAYANQEKALGERPIEAISHAVTKRFRPLLTTTVTTIVALLPLALSDPFWEPLALTIIFGLASSTFFVVVSFPYYYLASEWISRQFTKLFRRFKK